MDIERTFALAHSCIQCLSCGSSFIFLTVAQTGPLPRYSQGPGERLRRQYVTVDCDEDRISPR